MGGRFVKCSWERNRDDFCLRYDWPANMGPNAKKPCCPSCQETNDLLTDASQHTRIGECRDTQCECHLGVRESGGQDGGDGSCQYDSIDMKEVSRTRLDVNDVCYINDTLGLHRMENPSYVDGAVSMHLYCPPFDSCRVFDSRTGKSTQVKVTFWSEYGKRTNRDAAAPRPQPTWPIDKSRTGVKPEIHVLFDFKEI
ncbi:Cysteine dioxygenase type 1 [Eumeta japonica]|uniref:Cysteine dioxygenase n=1 Tax=Eumeta variegata TaxID=151549 RepID=A0A4C1ZN53_EUMVA|nr:Cysteine dioxygenase type 1 [Eumeta japonica]